LGIGLLPLSRRQQDEYALAFSVAEIMATLSGLAAGSWLWPPLSPLAERYPPAFLLMCGAAVLGIGAMKWDLSRWFGSPWVLFGLPLGFSVDNLLAGAALTKVDATPLGSAVLIGATGAAMSCGGLYLAGWVRTMIPRRPELVAGTYLLVLSLLQWMRG
jgi:putative Mn2+ efflux pump MntP